MIELTNIIIQNFLFFFLFFLPCTFVVKKFIYNNYVFDIFENVSFNILLYLNFLLLLSYFDIVITKSLKIFIVLFLLYSLINLINLRLYEIKKSLLRLEIVFLFITSLIIFFDIAFNLTFSWDTEKFWFEKVLNFSNGNSVENLVNISRSHYPYFFDMIWAFFWKFSLINNEYSGRLFFGFMYLISLSLLLNLLSLKRLIKFIFILLIILSTYNYREYFSGNKEIIVFSLISMSLYFLLKIKEKNEQNKNFNIEIVFFLLSSNLLIWTKQEGFIYLLNLIFSLVFFINIKINKKIIIILSCCLFYLVKIFIYNYYNFNLDLKSCCYYDFTINGIINKISFERFFLIVFFIFFVILKNPIFIVGLFFGVLGVISKKFLFKNFYLYSLIVTNFISVVIIFIMTDADLEYMLKTGVERLIFMFVPVLILMIVQYYNFFNKNLIKN